MAQEITLKIRQEEKNDLGDRTGFSHQINDLAANHRCQ